MWGHQYAPTLRRLACRIEPALDESAAGPGYAGISPRLDPRVFNMHDKWPYLPELAARLDLNATR